MAQIKEKVEELRRKIKAACGKCRRSAEEIAVLAATKYAESDQINEAIKAGISVIGENRIQDSIRKIPHLLQVRKHFIGHLQTNKVFDAVRLFDCIESVDSYRLAEMINVEAERSLKKMPVLIEINIAGEKNKYGVDPDEIHHFLHKIAVFKYLHLKGLMTVAPLEKDMEIARQYFRKMKRLFDLCKKEWKSFDTLSMGMSGDFETAIEEGATEVRIGGYLFK
jgi:PLP dependent protein